MEMRPNTVTVKNLTKRFGNNIVIDDLSLDIIEGAIVSILAPSGAGKTTLLRLIAGLERPTSGQITVFDGSVETPSPEIGFIFQEYSVFPWLTVAKNVEFGLRFNRLQPRAGASELEAQVRAICGEVGLLPYLSSFPSRLSGGQKQRVAIARSLVLNPKVLLCDEPFSSLDEPTRAELRALLLMLHQSHLMTTVFITHSIEEALFVGQKAIVCAGPPLREIAEIDIDFSHPRTEDLIESSAFVALRQHVRSIMSGSSSSRT